MDIDLTTLVFISMIGGYLLSRIPYFMRKLAEMNDNKDFKNRNK